MSAEIENTKSIFYLFIYFSLLLPFLNYNKKILKTNKKNRVVCKVRDFFSCNIVEIDVPAWILFTLFEISLNYFKLAISDGLEAKTLSPLILPNTSV